MEKYFVLGLLIFVVFSHFLATNIPLKNYFNQSSNLGLQVLLGIFELHLVHEIYFGAQPQGSLERPWGQFCT